GIRLLVDAVPGCPETAVEGDSLAPAAPYRIVNIGNSSKVRLEDFIEAIELATGKKAIRNYMDMQPGDIPATWADCTLLQRLTGYQPQTDIRDGMERFVEWYRDDYGREVKSAWGAQRTTRRYADRSSSLLPASRDSCRPPSVSNSCSRQVRTRT